MDITPRPIPANIAELLLKSNITNFTLKFSGGNDEGILNIEFDYKKDTKNKSSDLSENKLYDIVNNWVWDVFHFSGAGDGSMYGTNLKYDLVNGTVTGQDWYEEITTKFSEEDTVIMRVSSDKNIEGDNDDDDLP